MKRIFFCILFSASLFSANIVLAQKQMSNNPVVVKMIADDLNLYAKNNVVLTDIQVQRVSYILDMCNNKILSYQSDINMSSDDKLKSIAEVQNMKYNNMLGILNEAQYKVMDAYFKSNKMIKADK